MNRSRFARVMARARSILLRRRLATLGDGSTFQLPGPRIVGGERIAIGERVFGRPFVRLEVIRSAASPASGPILRIADRVYLGFHVSVFATRAVTIGEAAYLNGHVTIHDHYPPLDADAGEPLAQAFGSQIGDVEIGEQAWLGWGAVVMPGVRVGRHAVLGANSVALEDVPDYCVAVGNPAILVRRYDEAHGRWVRVASRPGEDA